MPVPRTPRKKKAAAPAAGEAKLSAPQRAMRRLGLVRDIDLTLHLPLRYEDETRVTPLAEARMGEEVQIEGTVTRQEVKTLGGWRRNLLVTLADGERACQLRFFNFYPSQQKQMAVGARIRARGVLHAGLPPTMAHPVGRAADGALPTALTPVYPSTAQLPQAYLRRAVLGALARADLSDTIPAELLVNMEGEPLWSLHDALHFLHQPPPGAPLLALQERTHPAWRRLKAEELLAQQLSQARARRERALLRAPQLVAGEGGLVQQLLAALPFTLTAAQQRVTDEIAADLARARPMNRLLQGDVGSGKTVVAALAACTAIDAGWQCALMAPTEILASQHFARISEWLAPLLAARGQGVAWLTGSQKRSERTAALDAIASGQAALVIGTHAVIEQQVQFARLALAIIDEQHRFGVAQRLALRQKSSESSENIEPHLLMMSATPIPRTLAMSHFADLDVSTIDALPPGRKSVATRLFDQQRRGEVIARLASHIAQGRQVYWVCPLIEESEALDLRNATETHATISAALPGCGVGLLHSRMGAADKRAVMQRFVRGETPVLVSTTVIEVGVDVPAASVMVIEHAERFGLSQLHQLRGRVGRGAEAAVCILLYGAPDGAGRLTDTARERLKTMRESNDGFEIARRDLALRGPGEFLGARQSGAALLRFADLNADAPLLRWAHHAAPLMLEQWPDMAARHIDRWIGAKAEYLKA
ncbi:MAG: ATP-dependent DNA helicase RecG [Ottowia sp.]|nr:ATP-dependent DNA helicase RecG [Ottowia sp.]